MVVAMLLLQQWVEHPPTGVWEEQGQKGGKDLAQHLGGPLQVGYHPPAHRGGSEEITHVLLCA
jgi:hypothetical protein